jgi:hypothetical protein
MPEMPEMSFGVRLGMAAFLGVLVGLLIAYHVFLTPRPSKTAPVTGGKDEARSGKATKHTGDLSHESESTRS